MVSREAAGLFQAITIVANAYFGFVAIALVLALIWAIYHRNDKK
ncbi:MAG: hypothetical protein AAB965_03175 [Patescibacteria group bacterium]